MARKTPRTAPEKPLGERDGADRPARPTDFAGTRHVGDVAALRDRGDGLSIKRPLLAPPRRSLASTLPRCTAKIATEASPGAQGDDPSPETIELERFDPDLLRRRWRTVMGRHPLRDYRAPNLLKSVAHARAARCERRAHDLCWVYGPTLSSAVNSTSAAISATRMRSALIWFQ